MYMYLCTASAGEFRELTYSRTAGRDEAGTGTRAALFASPTKKTSKARKIFKIALKTGPTKKDKTKFIRNEIGATSLLEKKLEQPPADRICSDLDLGPDFVAEFKTGFKTGFQLDQSSRAASHALFCEASHASFRGTVRGRKCLALCDTQGLMKW